MGQTNTTTITRTCDVCQKSVSLVQGHTTAEQLKAAAGWFVVMQEHWLKEDQLQSMAKLACSKTCALQILHRDMTDLPKTEFTCPIPAAEPLDMTKLAN
jgi:hypothetical protein